MTDPNELGPMLGNSDPTGGGGPPPPGAETKVTADGHAVTVGVKPDEPGTAEPISLAPVEEKAKLEGYVVKRPG
jgi:hypothetical protein